jgi:hypothetical protein
MLICELVSHRPSSGDQRFMFIVNLTVYIVFAIDYIMNQLLRPNVEHILVISRHRYQLFELRTHHYPMADRSQANCRFRQMFVKSPMLKHPPRPAQMNSLQ